MSLLTQTLQIKTPRWAKPLLGPSRYKGAHGGRGSGKSHLFAEMLVERCLYAKTDAVCLRETQKSLDQSVKKLIEDKIQSLGVGHCFDVQHDRIYSNAGGVIIFNGMQNHTAESIKSLEGFDVAWFEEAQTADQLSLDMLRPTIRKPMSELWFSWNPRFKTDPVDVLLRGPMPPPDAVVVEVNYTDNPWFPKTLVAEMEYDKRRDPDKYAHVWLGQYQQNSNARVFKNWRIEEFDAPKEAIHRLGADWGFANDPSTLVRCHIIGRTIYVDYEAWMIGCDIPNLPLLFNTVPESEKWPIIADSARPETIDFMRKNGYPKILAAVKGAKSLVEGVEWLKSYDIVVHPRCTHTIDELSTYSYKVDKQTGAIYPVLEDIKNHIIDALRYACESARRAANASKAIDVTPIPNYSPFASKRYG